MRLKRIPIIALPVVLSLLVAACAETPQQRAAVNHEMGCLAGGVAGALIGAAIGDQFGRGAGRDFARTAGGIDGAVGGRNLTCG